MDVDTAATSRPMSLADSVASTLLRTDPALARRVLALAWPAVIEQTLAMMISLVDFYIVGHLGAAALDGVGLGGQMLFLTASFLSAIGVGSTALVARHIGAKEPEDATRTARQSVALAMAIGLLMAVVGALFARPIIAWFGGEPDVIEQGTRYLRTVAPSFAFYSVLLIGNAVLRGAGDTRTPLLVMLVVNVINIGVAWSLTQGVAGLPKLGVVGSGLGAASGQTIGGLIVLALLVRGRAGIRLGRQVPRWDPDRIRRILNIGLPAGAEQILLQFALTSLTVVIARFGTEAYAAHQVAWRIAQLSFLPGWGFAIAASTLVGQELGARQPQRANESGYAAFRAALMVMTLMAVVIFVFDRALIRMFIDDPLVIVQGVPILQIAAIIQPVMAASFVFSGGLRGAGDTRVTLAITIFSVWGLRVIITYLLGQLFELELVGAWIAIAIDFSFRGLMFWWRFRSGKWQSIRV
jgi:MATE family multidrug resistance protein